MSTLVLQKDNNNCDEEVSAIYTVTNPVQFTFSGPSNINAQIYFNGILLKTLRKADAIFQTNVAGDYDIQIIGPCGTASVYVDDTQEPIPATEVLTAGGEDLTGGAAYNLPDTLVRSFTVTKQSGTNVVIDFGSTSVTIVENGSRTFSDPEVSVLLDTTNITITPSADAVSDVIWEV